MNPTRTIDRYEHGAALLELCAGLALAAAAATALVSGFEPLACAIRLEAARTTVIDTLLEARRKAYAEEMSFLVGAKRGESAVSFAGGPPRSLGKGVILETAPADGSIQFRANGLADNATIALSCGESRASVVVNQRGVIR